MLELLRGSITHKEIAMAGLSVNKVNVEDIFVPPYPAGYDKEVWVVFRDGKPFRIYHSEDLALKEKDRLEGVYASLPRDESAPEEQKLKSSSSKSTPP